MAEILRLGWSNLTKCCDQPFFGMLCTTEEELVNAIITGKVEEIYAWNVPLKERCPEFQFFHI